MLLIGVTAAIAATAYYASRSTLPAPPSTLRLALPPAEGLAIGAGPDYPFGLSAAPDGRRVVFPAAQDGVVQLWLRDLTTSETQPLPGTEEGVLPFWAPDGRAIGFFSGGRLRVITLENARVTDLAEAPSPRGGAWHPGGDIIFSATAEGGLSKRRPDAGVVEPFTTVDRAASESSHRHPVFADEGRHVVFYVQSDEATRRGLWLAAMADPSNRRRLINSNAHGLAIGQMVVYATDDALVAQRLDVDTRSLVNRPLLLGTAVGRSPQHQLFATAGGDLLIYGAPASGLRELRWIGRTGATAGTVGEPMNAWDVRVAPGGGTVAVTRLDPQLNTLDIWAYDGERPLPRRVSPAIDADEAPAWSSDGARIAWVTGRRTLTVRSAMADAPDETVRKFDHPVRISDWSPDFRWILVTETNPASHDDIWLVSPDSASGARAYAQSPFNEGHGVVSPDGRWIAYASDESGRAEIYVDTFPAPGRRGRMTSGGGADPRWRADGGELYFRRGTEIHAVTPSFTGPLPEAAASERLFDARADVRAYDVSADGRRFLLNLPAIDNASPLVNVIVNVSTVLRTSSGAASTAR